jgi:hypothetical protein
MPPRLEAGASTASACLFSASTRKVCRAGEGGRCGASCTATQLHVTTTLCGGIRYHHAVRRYTNVVWGVCGYLMLPHHESNE